MWVYPKFPNELSINLNYSKQGIEKTQASLLLSIIGITNTFARILFGYVADFPSVDALFLNNICLVLGTISVGLTPFCASFTSYIAVAFFFGLAIGKTFIFRSKSCSNCAISYSRLHFTDFHYSRWSTGSRETNKCLWPANFVPWRCRYLWNSTCWCNLWHDRKLRYSILHGRSFVWLIGNCQLPCASCSEVEKTAWKPTSRWSSDANRGERWRRGWRERSTDHHE